LEDLPAQAREEEKYLYKYFKEKGPKSFKKQRDVDEDDIEIGDDDNEDPELEKFA